MRIPNHLTNAALDLLHAPQTQGSRIAGALLTTSSQLMPSLRTTQTASQKATASQGQQQTGDNGSRNWTSRSMKSLLGLAGVAYAYDQTTNHFFLSTTTLHDGKQGFTSNERLDKATQKARQYFQNDEHVVTDREALDCGPPAMLRRVGNNQFLTMTDYRAATRIYLGKLVDTEQSRQSVMTSLDCLKGSRVKAESIARYKPTCVPADPDLTKSPLYDRKGKYSLSGVPDKESGSSGYASRSIMHPFVLKSYSHFLDTCEERGWTPRQCVNTLEAMLTSRPTLNEDSQFSAGRAILNLRQVYAHEQYWGHAENVIMKMLAEHGLLLPEETLKLDKSLMFEDPNKSIWTRNTSVMGPALHKLEAYIHTWRLKDDPVALEDMKPMIKSKNMENMPLAHFKVNEQFNGFEDCSGLGDSFTCANAAACINHARLMSGEKRMSESDVITLIGCLYSIYADAAGTRHSLHEVARGCFAGAGYTIEDADRFYERTCKEAAHAFYKGLGSNGTVNAVKRSS